MKKLSYLLVLLFSISLLLMACGQSDENGTNESTGEEESKESESVEKEKSEKQDIIEVSDEVIQALDDQDMERVATHVHPKKGLLFSPYVYVTEDAIIFEQQEVSTLLEQDEVFTWGRYDGKGTEINLTPDDYFAEFLNVFPFLEPDDVLVDDLQDRGNTLNNIAEVFPNAEVVEYHYEGSEENAGIDWESLILVYEKDTEGTLKLIAIVRDMWTV